MCVNTLMVTHVKSSKQCLSHNQNYLNVTQYYYGFCFLRIGICNTLNKISQFPAYSSVGWLYSGLQRASAMRYFSCGRKCRWPLCSLAAQWRVKNGGSPLHHPGTSLQFQPWAVKQHCPSPQLQVAVAVQPRASNLAPIQATDFGPFITMDAPFCLFQKDISISSNLWTFPLSYLDVAMCLEFFFPICMCSGQKGEISVCLVPFQNTRFK